MEVHEVPEDEDWRLDQIVRWSYRDAITGCNFEWKKLQQHCKKLMAECRTFKKAEEHIMVDEKDQDVWSQHIERITAKANALQGAITAFGNALEALTKDHRKILARYSRQRDKTTEE
jgi:hypothetical protein